MIRRKHLKLAWIPVAILTAIAVASAAEAAAAAAAPIVLSRSAPWQLDYDNNACHLIGLFGHGDQQTGVRFTKFGSGNQFQLALFGQSMRVSTPDAKVSLDFGVSGGPTNVSMQAGSLGGMPALQATTWFGLKSVEMKPNWSLEKRKEQFDKLGAEMDHFADDGKVDRLLIEVPKLSPVQLQLGSMVAPMAKMQGCIDDMYKSWGYDPAVIRSLSAGPEPKTSPGTWMDWSSYPAKAIPKQTNALVPFRLDVDEKGAVLACHILHQGNPQEFEKNVCNAMMRRAAFKSARDATGKPVKAFWRSAVRYMAPAF